ncbi:MAG: hypothetical protein KatS3mg032_0288 [Cyclobacteriaceae bacterium]|nr:MAG: hypothetical protein KatS3mg032_0288 [Cyclobacteriaceae bacterium]
MMNMKNMFKKATWVCAIFLAVQACEEEGDRIVLGDPSDFVAPEWISTATAPAKVLDPENEQDEFETFIWANAQYGAPVSVRYEIEISRYASFNPDSTRTLTAVEGTTTNDTRWSLVTVKQMNDAMLALGLPGFAESTVYLRVKSTINGITNEPLYSGTIARRATTYRTSDCGNFCSVGIIGSATPGGWLSDIDMRLNDPTGVDRSTWTVTVYLLGGQVVKFRALDSWDTNWGSSDFPSGTGVQDGPNIPIPTDGYYKVLFNDETGAYQFTLISNTYSQIGVIGTGVGGWTDSDEKFLTQSGTSGAAAHVWTGTITFSAGEVKFRANASWSNNWGEEAYPSGYGVANGPNIDIPTGGTYFVYFNSASGEYMIGPTANAVPYTSVGVIGPATPNGWDGPDENLTVNPANAYKFSRVLTLIDGELKFRADDAWTVNWGASTFPAGIGVQSGANIPVQAGTYFVTFNSLTGEYRFLK